MKDKLDQLMDAFNHALWEYWRGRGTPQAVDEARTALRDFLETPRPEAATKNRDEIIEECARTAYHARMDGAPVEYSIRMLKAFPSDHVQDAEPDGYAVVMEGGEGPFVGCYRMRQIAEQACARQPAGHGDVVLPVFFTRSPLAHKE